MYRNLHLSVLWSEVFCRRVVSVVFKYANDKEYILIIYLELFYILHYIENCLMHSCSVIVVVEISKFFVFNSILFIVLISGVVLFCATVPLLLFIAPYTLVKRCGGYLHSNPFMVLNYRLKRINHVTISHDKVWCSNRWCLWPEMFRTTYRAVYFCNRDSGVWKSPSINLGLRTSSFTQCKFSMWPTF